MQSGATFAEVLDQTLGAYQPRAAAPASHLPFPPSPPNPFLFSTPYERFPWVTAGNRNFTAAAVWAGQSSSAQLGVPSAARMPAPAAARTTAAAPRRLTIVQRCSLDAFGRLGATLPANFSAAELRSAFRTLARQYHPDRHPDASHGEKASLSRRFNTITTHHEILLTALDATRS